MVGLDGEEGDSPVVAVGEGVGEEETTRVISALFRLI